MEFLGCLGGMLLLRGEKKKVIRLMVVGLVVVRFIELLYFRL